MLPFKSVSLKCLEENISIWRQRVLEYAFLCDALHLFKRLLVSVDFINRIYSLWLLGFESFLERIHLWWEKAPIWGIIICLNSSILRWLFSLWNFFQTSERFHRHDIIAINYFSVSKFNGSLILRLGSQFIIFRIFIIKCIILLLLVLV